VSPSIRNSETFFRQHLDDGAVEGFRIERVSGQALEPDFLAVVGVVVLVAPRGLATPGSSDARSPDPLGVVLMIGAGVAWGLYSLAGRSAREPTAATARNFVVAAAVGALALALSGADLEVDRRGALLAICLRV